MGQKSITIILIDVGPNSNDINRKKLATQIIHKKLIYRLKTELVGIISLGKVKPIKEQLSDTVRIVKQLSCAKTEDLKLIENLITTEYEANVLEGVIESCNLLTKNSKLKDYTKNIILISKEPYISQKAQNSQDIQEKLQRCLNLLDIKFDWWGGKLSKNTANFQQFFNKLKSKQFIDYKKCNDLYYIWNTQLDEARSATNFFYIDFILGSSEINIKFPMVGYKYFIVADEKVNIIEAQKVETKRNIEEEGEYCEEYNYYLGDQKIDNDFILERLDLSESNALVHGFIPFSNIQGLHFHSAPIHFYLNKVASSKLSQAWSDFIETLMEMERAALVRLNHPKDDKNSNKPKILSMAMMIPKRRKDNNLPYFICRLLPFQNEDILPYLIDSVTCELELNEEPLIEAFMNQLTINDNGEDGGNSDGDGIDLSRLIRPPASINNEQLKFEDIIEYLPSKIRENLEAWDNMNFDLKQVFDKYTS